jgi:hypothetical protein
MIYRCSLSIVVSGKIRDQYQNTVDAVTNGHGAINYPLIGHKLEDRHVDRLMKDWSHLAELLHLFWPADFFVNGTPI